MKTLQEIEREHNQFMQTMDQLDSKLDEALKSNNKDAIYSIANSMLNAYTKGKQSTTKVVDFFSDL